MKEFTIKAIILGIFLSIIFGCANAYLGLKMGMTVSASIPAAVISMAILRGILRKGTILENNIVQTIASAGESLAAGVIFTVPALIMMGLNVSILYIFLVSFAGGVLGVLLMIVVRKRFIEDEDKTLPYPEGRACAEVLKAGDEGGEKAKNVFIGITVGFLYKILSMGFHLFKDIIEFLFKIRTNLMLSFDNSPSLLGVGFILGLRISFLVMAGGLLGWFGIMPLIQAFLPEAKDLMPNLIWSKYIRYIGAGAVLAGGIISFSKAIISIFSKGKISLNGIITKKDLPFGFILAGLIFIYIFLSLIPLFKQNFISSLFIIIFSFLFVIVSSRIVGIVGSSSNPVSGMTIATLLIISLIFLKLGFKGQEGIIAALTVGAIVCIGAAIAGDTSQDLKTGFLLGATPKFQQIGEFIGVIFSAIFIGWTLFLLNKAYKIGSQILSAPQATLMKLVVEGVFKENMPWELLIAGIGIAISIEILGLPSLPFAVGLYLPLSLSTTIGIGGIISHFIKEKGKGILLSSGLVAGDALAGIFIAILIVTRLPIFSFKIPFLSDSPFFSLFFLLILGIFLFFKSK
ncbi:MAG: oligopeptide transporter, OPT family [candidate division WOR-3 bacterium]